MNQLIPCRRTFLATLALLLLFVLSWKNGTDVSMAFVGIIGTVAGSNAYEKSNKKSPSNGQNSQS